MTSSAAAPASKEAWNARFAGKVPHDLAYYRKCLVGGAIACGATHTLITPLDVVKCNMQLFPEKYKSLGPGLRTLVTEEGAAAMWKGWAPTAIGYSIQGTLKFGLNEVFKDAYANAVGEENAVRYRALIWAGAAASAEFFADIGLVPLEMVKVKVQTSPPKLQFPTAFRPALATMWLGRAEYRFPFGSLVPLWSRQIPYTVTKFVGFEYVVEQFYKHVFTEPKNTYSSATQLGVTFASGYIAGVGSAIISQPADNLVSQMGKAENGGKSLGEIAREVGVRKLFLGGLGTRILMIGTLTGLQWWIYDSWKTAMGLGTTGGDAVAKM